MTAKLNTILKEAFSECFQQWQHHWEKCVETQGDYFEGNQVSSAPGMPVLFFRPKVEYFSNRPRMYKTIKKKPEGQIYSEGG